MADPIKILTLHMIVKDEAERLGPCLRSIRDFVDEIVIVDTGSTDDTVEIARSFGARVEHFAWVDDFSAARNYALSFVSTPWTIWIDADDLVLNPHVLAPLIREAHERKHDSIWSLYYQDENSYQRRLHVFRTKRFRWVGAVHESPQPRPGITDSGLLSDLEVLHRKPEGRKKEAARRYLEILLKSDPENWVGLAESYRYLGMVEDDEDEKWRCKESAEALYWEAFNYPNTNDPTKYMCLLQAALLNLEMGPGSMDRRKMAFKTALLGVSLEPKRAECMVLLGQAAQLLGRYSEAEACYREAMTLTPPDDVIGIVLPAYYDSVPRLCLQNLEQLAQG